MAAMLLVIGLGWSTGIRAQTVPSSPAVAEQHYQAGLAKQSAAEITSQQEPAAQLYRQAIAEYQAAVQAKVDHYQAQVYWGISLTQLGVLMPTDDERNQYFVEAVQRFTRAADCPGADYVVFDQWATLLDSYIYALVPDDAQRLTVLQEIERVCERGLKLAHDAPARAQLEHRLGAAQQRRAGLTADPAAQSALRQEADRHRRAAGQVLAAHQHYQAGLTAQNQAEMATKKEDARRLYRDAIDEYQASVAAQPDLYQAQVYWGISLTQLALLVVEQTERNQLLIEALQRFAAAAGCPGADYVVFEQWAILLRSYLYDLVPDDAQRVTVLKETIDVVDRGLQLTSEPNLRAQLERQRGAALLKLAGLESDPVARQAVLERAVVSLQAASKVAAVQQALRAEAALGNALFQLGRTRSDPMRLREAAAELAATLRSYPRQNKTEYTLAATWSLLGDADQAARHLGVAIDHDPDGGLARRATADPDLAAVRASPAYTAALDRRRRRLAEDQAKSFFRQALQAQQTAERTNDLLVAAALLQQATALYQQAVDATPDHYPSQALYATALVQLASLNARHPDQQRPFLEAARTRFAAATQCPEVDAQLYDQWATFLLNACYPLLTKPADQLQFLTDARQVLDQGIARARFSGLRGRLESQLGTCLVLLAQLQTGLSPAAGDDGASPSGGLRSLATSSGTETNSTPLYAEAIKHFQTADAAETGSRTANFYELWGIALLRVGQNSKDTMLVRQATERLLKSLELKATNPTVHYNLACAYSQLRQPDQALRHLERCLVQDPQGLFYTSAEKDPDLEALRRTDAFTKLFHRRPKPDADTHGTVSEK